MTIENDVLIQRLRTVADDVPIPPIPWTAVVTLSHRRRRRRIAAVTASALAAATAVAVSAVVGLDRGAPSTATSQSPPTSPSTGSGTSPLGSRPGVPPDIGDKPISGKFDANTVVRRSALANVPPYAFELCDGTFARVVAATLLLTPAEKPRPHLGPNGHLASAALTNAVAVAPAKQVAKGRWVVRLRVPTNLPPGTYQLAFAEVDEWTRDSPGGDAARTQSWSDITNFGTLTVRP